MITVRAVLYTIWCLIPVLFFGLALHTKLEARSKKKKKDNSGEFLRQGIFCLMCVALAIFVEYKFLKTLVDQYSPTFIPIGLYQVLLLPFILYIAALLAGPTKNASLADTKARKQRRQSSSKKKS